MHYWQSIVIGGFIVTCVVSYSIFIFFWSKGSCPVGTFSCSSDENCVPQSQVCNSHQDCPNGEDEEPVLCTDMHGSINAINQTLSTSLTTLEYHLSILHQCYLTNYPNNCICKSRYRIYCKNTNLLEFPNNVSTEVTHLILPNNSITYLNKENLMYYENLEVLHLERNQLINISNQTFSAQTNMLRLFLTYNNLTVIKNGVFDGLDKLLWLFLYNNKIKIFEMTSIRNLKSLQWMDISKNHLTLEHESFPKLLNLSELFLDSNNISIVKNNTFSQLINLELLNLQKNEIAIIEADAFKNLKILKELNLHGNKLSRLHSTLFSNVVLLSKLYLGSNPFHQFPTDVFNKLENLASLNLDEIDIENIDINIFLHLKNLKSVYFKKYYYCSFAPTVPRCRPLSDGISSTTHLLEKPLLRYATWITSIITCIGNILVIWGRYTIRDDNKVLNLVIRNLAGSDLLMGIYLMIIAVKDLKYRGVYNQYAYSWMSSWLCTFTGILAMTSSEVSILLLVFMSAERFLLICLPFGHFPNMNVKAAFISMVTIWILGVGLAVIPTMEFYFSTRFYGLNGLCFPLYIDEPFQVGWKYSAIITFGINTLSLLLIATIYCVMFVNIWKTRNATSLPTRDYEFAIRFFFIVLTDVSCWFPIIVTKLLAISGTEISGDLHSWLVVFVLPINSAVNPLLYTFTTMKYRSKFSVPWGSNEEDKHLNQPEGVSRFSPQSI